MNDYLERTESYLTEKLIPFWAERIAEPNHGGFQTNYDRNGERTEVTEKTFLCQGRCIFTLSHAVRLGFDWPGSRGTIAQGIDFVERHFRDQEDGGYLWIVEEDGTVRDDRNVMYGLSFIVYGLAEYALLTGDRKAETEARRVFDLILSRAADIHYGGFFEHFDHAFQLESVRPDGMPHKSLDVHMHLMEAFTTLYELTRAPRHRQALEQVTELIFDRMIAPETGTGVAMFSPDWTPVNNVQLGTLWGADRFDETGKPPEITSYGHNIELAWLYLHSLDVLGVPRSQGRERVLPIFQHTAERGVDWECGGLFVEGHRTGAATETTKEFWQQAEALIGFLDAYEMTGDERYRDAFANVWTFVFEKVINWDQGEWFALLDRKGNVLWDHMGHNWKICYHTLRAMCEVVVRLRRLCDS
ncbi:MAG: N-acylglucosamine 2-epimerase [Lentisphaerae bacterium]|mgnify:CR=1 FL=1|jgi:mannose 2-epimerase|nr:N-acylglucosamine 2-epimerase [Lentisphaerota bacterium]MBT4819451.1 N-acylglucosamine 2-epimerase [Lentisphaerota bacterium]MBT5612837.1 N-acylglucosamine 2-epimerase [Lentisphaerota bacterium]MBT7059837.1 N-acylglucosamine 2-epimerase [Lentisphaerota bacterium]MBT7846083.1 N-acylglucosamine 2-epimerase [Lentisphaerota bacterium]